MYFIFYDKARNIKSDTAIEDISNNNTNLIAQNRH